MKVIVMGNCTIDVSFAVSKLPREGESVLASGRQVDLGGKRRQSGSGRVALRRGNHPGRTDRDGRRRRLGLPAPDGRRTSARRHFARRAVERPIRDLCFRGRRELHSQHLSSRAFGQPGVGLESRFKNTRKAATYFSCREIFRWKPHTPLWCSLENPASWRSSIRAGSVCWASLFPMANVVILNRSRRSNWEVSTIPWRRPPRFKPEAFLASF